LLNFTFLHGHRNRYVAFDLSIISKLYAKRALGRANVDGGIMLKFVLKLVLKKYDSSGIGWEPLMDSLQRGNKLYKKRWKFLTS
jgi:hypothetical protein